VRGSQVVCLNSVYGRMSDELELKPLKFGPDNNNDPGGDQGNEVHWQKCLFYLF